MSLQKGNINPFYNLNIISYIKAKYKVSSSTSRYMYIQQRPIFYLKTKNIRVFNLTFLTIKL